MLNSNFTKTTCMKKYMQKPETVYRKPCPSVTAIE